MYFTTSEKWLLILLNESTKRYTFDVIETLKCTYRRESG